MNLQHLWVALTTAAGAALLAGCATEAKFAARLDDYIGKPESAIIGKMGPPDRSHAMADGSRVLQWRASRTVHMTFPGGTTPVRTETTGTIGNKAFDATSTTHAPAPPTIIPIEQSCTLNVTIDPAGRVTAWSASGNNCRSQ